MAEVASIVYPILGIVNVVALAFGFYFEKLRATISLLLILDLVTYVMMNKIV